MTANDELISAIFVLYDNGGIVAFTDARETADNIPGSHLSSIRGAWNERGQRIDLISDKWGRAQVVVSGEQPDPEALRTLLTKAIQDRTETNLNRLSYARLIFHCYAVMRLKTPSELRTERWGGCYNGCFSFPLLAVRRWRDLIPTWRR